MKVIKHTKRYVVQWLCLGQWVNDKSFHSLQRASRYVRRRDKWSAYEHRLIDTEEP